MHGVNRLRSSSPTVLGAVIARHAAPQRRKNHFGLLERLLSRRVPPGDPTEREALTDVAAGCRRLTRWPGRG